MTRSKVRTLSGHIARLHEVPEADKEWIDIDAASPTPEPPTTTSTIIVKQAAPIEIQEDEGEEEVAENNPKVCRYSFLIVILNSFGSAHNANV
jgi:hypothetical protein